LKFQKITRNFSNANQSFDLAEIMRFLIRTYESKFVRNVAILVSGTAGAQAISIAFSPVITRLYNPYIFGLLGVFVALLEMLTPAAALTFPIAIVLPNNDSDAKGIARLSAYIAFVVALLMTVVILLKGDFVLTIIGAREISVFVSLLPLAMFFAALIQIAQQWLIRTRQFSITAHAEVAQAFIINSFYIGVGWFYPSAGVLIVLATIGKVIHLGFLTFGIRYSPRISIPNLQQINNDNTSTWKLAKKYYDFPLYRAPQVLINTISQNLPVLMLAAFFGPVSAGLYAICRKVLGMPSQLIAQSFGDVFYSTITESAHNGKDLTKFIIKATLGLAALGFAPFAMVIAFGPWLFGVVFGSEWVAAGEYARWLSIMMFFYFINKPCVAAVPVLGLQKGLLIYEFFSTGAKLIAIYIGFHLFNDDKLAIALFGIFGAIAYTALIAWIIMSSSFQRRGHGNA
jgi:O-antigen/teichoic acid export membrane protein